MLATPKGISHHDVEWEGGKRRVRQVGFAGETRETACQLMPRRGIFQPVRVKVEGRFRASAGPLRALMAHLATSRGSVLLVYSGLSDRLGGFNPYPCMDSPIRM